MADFDTDWKITGSPDPATPDPQPHQVQAQPKPQQSYQAPVQQASQTVPGFVPAPVQQQPVAQPQFIGYLCTAMRTVLSLRRLQSIIRKKGKRTFWK